MPCEDLEGWDGGRGGRLKKEVAYNYGWFVLSEKAMAAHSNTLA